MFFSVNVSLARACVWKVIVCDVVDIVLLEEVEGNDPRAGAYDFVNPFAVEKDIAALFLVHHDFALLFDCLFIAGDAHDEVHVREQLLDLLEEFSVTHVIHVEHTIRVDANRVFGVSSIWSSRVCFILRSFVPVSFVLGLAVCSSSGDFWLHLVCLASSRTFAGCRRVFADFLAYLFLGH